jgi:hypothetical protein
VLPGLCPELQEVFAMTMTSSPLPFPRLHPLEEPVDEEVPDVEDVEFRRGHDSRDSALVSPARISHDNTSTDHSQRLPHRESSSKKSRHSVQNEDVNVNIDASLGFDMGTGFDLEGFEPLPPIEADFDTSLSRIGRESTATAGTQITFTSAGLGDRSVDVSINSKHPHADDDSLRSSDERKWSDRTTAVMNVVRSALHDVEVTQTTESVSFGALSHNASKHTAATCFMELLQLKSWGYLELTQTRPDESRFGDISITATVCTLLVTPL